MARKPAQHVATDATHVTDATHPNLASALARLDRWLGRHRRRYAKGLAPGASSKELDTMQKALGIPLPPDLRTLLAWHNGQSDDFVGHFENNWDLLSTDRIVEAKRDLDKESAQKSWQPSWIPIFETDAGDNLVLDTTQAGAPVRDSYLGSAEHPIVAASLAAWLNDFITAVERGHYHEDSESGAFLRA